MGVEVCPVHKTEYKSSRFSSIHVGTMSYQPEPHGLKRKRLEEDEKDLSRPIRHPPQFLQEMYEITNDKIKKVQAEKSPPLLRLVLMNNIIRKLRDNLEKDGIYVSGLARAATTPVWCDESNQVSDLDPPPSSSNDVFSYFNYPLSGNGTDRPPTPIPMSPTDYSNLNYVSEQYRSLMDIEDSPRVATPPVRPGYERGGESGALWTEDNDRLSSLNWSSVLKSANFDLSNCSSDCSISDETGSNTSLHTLMPAVTSIETYLCSSGVYSASSSSSPNVNSLSGNTSPVSGTSPTSSEDEIFGDVDLTLYDYDYTPLSPPNVAMAPLSAEELMWSLSNDTRPTNSEEREYTSVRT